MENIKQLNVEDIVKKQPNFLEKTFEYTEETKKNIHRVANEFGFQKAIVNRNKGYYLHDTGNSFEVRYRNKAASQLN